MAKAIKKAAKMRADKYKEKIKINGSFNYLMNELVPSTKKDSKKKPTS